MSNRAFRARHLSCGALPFAYVISAAVAFATVGLPISASAQSKATWQQVKDSKVLRVGAIPTNPPYWYKDRETGAWKGFVVDMADNLAKELGVKLELVETTWKTAVLDLQGNKIDMMFSFMATPQRAMAIDFAGPIYRLGYSMINSNKFQGKTWDDYNKPEVKMAVQMGTSNEEAAARFAPKANRLSFQELNESVMSVQSGRADAVIVTTFDGLVAKTRNPELGDFVTPTPTHGLPSYIGLRRESDKTFKEFIGYWAEYNMLLGKFEDMIISNLDSIGVPKDKIPSDFHAY